MSVPQRERMMPQLLEIERSSHSGRILNLYVLNVETGERVAHIPWVTGVVTEDEPHGPGQVTVTLNGVRVKHSEFDDRDPILGEVR